MQSDAPAEAFDISDHEDDPWDEENEDAFYGTGQTFVSGFGDFARDTQHSSMLVNVGNLQQGTLSSWEATAETARIR